MKTGGITSGGSLVSVIQKTDFLNLLAYDSLQLSSIEMKSAPPTLRTTPQR